MNNSIKKKYINNLIQKASIVNNYEICNQINEKKLEERKDEGCLLIFLAICTSAFFLLAKVLGGFSFELFLFLLLAGNLPVIGLYLYHLIANTRLKRVQMNKDDLLCYSSSHFSVRYVNNTENREIRFVLDDEIELEISYFDFMMAIRDDKNYNDKMRNFELMPAYLKSINIYFYEKLLKKDRKAYTLTFDIRENVENL